MVFVGPLRILRLEPDHLLVQFLLVQDLDAAHADLHLLVRKCVNLLLAQSLVIL